MADFIKKLDDDILERAEAHDEKVIKKEEERIAKHEAELKDHDKGLVHDYLESRVAGEKDREEVKAERAAEDAKKIAENEKEIAEK